MIVVENMPKPFLKNEAIPVKGRWPWTDGEKLNDYINDIKSNLPNKVELVNNIKKMVPIIKSISSKFKHIDMEAWLCHNEESCESWMILKLDKAWYSLQCKNNSLILSRLCNVKLEKGKFSAEFLSKVVYEHIYSDIIIDFMSHLFSAQADMFDPDFFIIKHINNEELTACDVFNSLETLCEYFTCVPEKIDTKKTQFVIECIYSGPEKSLYSPSDGVVVFESPASNPGCKHKLTIDISGEGRTIFGKYSYITPDTVEEEIIGNGSANTRNLFKFLNVWEHCVTGKEFRLMEEKGIY